MAGSVLIDTKEEMVANLFDGKIFIKKATGWDKYTGNFYRSSTEPSSGANDDIWLNNTNNKLYLYSNSAWVVTNRMLYFTENPMNEDEGNVKDYNVLSGIIEVGPIVKIGDGGEFNEDKVTYDYPFINPADNKLYVKTTKGTYRVTYDKEYPNKSLSMATALSFNNNLYPGLDFRKTSQT